MKSGFTIGLQRFLSQTFLVLWYLMFTNFALIIKTIFINSIESSPVTDSLPPSSLSPTYHLQSPSITSSRLQLSSTSSIRLQFPSVTGFRHPTPLTPVLSAPSIVSSCIPTQTMCSGGNEDDNITIIGTIALICLLLISVVTITIITLLWRRRRQGKSNLVDNVAYNCHECEIKENKMATSHGVKEVSMNADYEYILSTPKQDPVNIATSTNDAYNITNFHAVVTDVNVAYGATCTSPRFTESTTQDIPTSANEAYITTDISISDNPAYVAVTAITDDTLENNTCLPSRPRESAQDIPTSPNEAYITTDISTTDNPAYIAVTDDNLEYDYI